MEIEGWNDPAAGLQHLAGRLGVVPFIDVPETRRAQVGESETGSHDKKQRPMSRPVIAVSEHLANPSKSGRIPSASARTGHYRNDAHSRETNPGKRRPRKAPGEMLDIRRCP